MVYIRSNDLGAENYIKYAVFIVDYDAKTVTLDGELNSTDLLEVSPAKGSGDSVLELSLPLPEGLNGSYTFDVYRDGNIAYTKTVQDGGAAAGKTISFDIEGEGKETVAVYVTSNDLGQDNYVLYASYIVDHDAGTVTLSGELNETDLLKITP